ncbi:hypothetical protein Bca52824_083413 [Brassica carinata]|uniref:Phospholipid-transporting ATPase n=1 Tax=Brassica carinata TaxID=52824 RepID=A0A8X7TT21_BRACI|nr:hypothetical protein Bca52824_083413 [Brassica carinata]
MAGNGTKRPRKRRRRIQLSKLYTLTCTHQACFKQDHSQIGGPGYSRVVFCNEPDSPDADSSNYSDNYVRTTKYTLTTFLPKSLFEQFRRVANFYFLVTGILSFTPLAPYTASSAIVPLLFVIGATMVKAVEDWRRKKQDIEVNNRRVKVHRGDGNFDSKSREEFFPADLVLLSSSYEDAICYVETMNLDGETNLKVKQGLEVTSSLREDINFKGFEAFVKCEDPNANLYSFVGTMELKGAKYPLSPQQLLLRDSKLRNTEFIFGAVIFTGHDTKVIQNSTDPPSKRSMIEKKMDKIIYLMFFMVVLMSFIGSVIFGVTTRDDFKDGVMRRWYLKPDSSSVFFDPKRAHVAAIYHFLTAAMLYSYFIPISLYVSIEIVKVLQSIFINQDIHMYYEEADKPARARTSNLNEELGQVDTILSDKTGTLTCNSMEFIKCSVAGTAYGRGITEVEMAMGRRKGSPLVLQSNEDDVEYSKEPFAEEPTVKGFNFRDERIMNGNWVTEPHADVIQKFFRLLEVCHTVIPEVDEDTEKISYEAEELGFEFYNRTQTTISVRELDLVTGKRVERLYKVLNVLEFNSTRKRMSVIVEEEDGKLLLLCKGADKLSKNGREFEEETKDHVNEYADAGLRTLILAYRELDEKTKSSVSADRESRIEEVTEKVEKDLILLGATAVPDCIDKLAQAGIKIWVLTGDKMETAINIGYRFLGITLILSTLLSSCIQFCHSMNSCKNWRKDAIAKCIVADNQWKGSAKVLGGNSNAFALIIDGKSLAYALDDDVKHIFLELAVGCFCHLLPFITKTESSGQSLHTCSLVTRLVKSGNGKTTLAIGDGANDVGMLQEADIGVGISGVEGMQAVMSSDIAIAQFRYLERLLLVHGHWCYRRISTMVCYFFYKNITFGFTLFLYEAYTTFSATPAYNDWFLSLYNVFFSSLPVIALGVFDQDVSARYCLKFPLLYQEGVQNVLFSWRRILGWMFNGFYSALIIFFLCKISLEPQILGGTMYTCIVWVVNLQMALAISYFTLIQHIVIWGPSSFGTSSSQSLLKLWPSLSYWVVTLCGCVDFVAVLRLLGGSDEVFPMYHGMIQWLRYEGQCNDPEYCDMVRQRSIRPTTVGFTARLEAKRRSVRRSESI